MKFTVADLLDQLSPSGAVPRSKLEKALGLSTEAERQNLGIGLEALSRLGIVNENDEGVQRQENQDLIPARLRCSSKGFCFALRDDGAEDIYIRDHQLNHAWNGDRVLVRITREGGRRRSPEGGVQCILDRQTTSLLAQVEKQQERLVAAPLDDRLLTTVGVAGQGQFPPRTRTGTRLSKWSSIASPSVSFFPRAMWSAACRSTAEKRQTSISCSPSTDFMAGQPPPGAVSRLRPPRAVRISPGCPPCCSTSGTGEGVPSLPALSLEERELGWRLWIHAPSVAERFSLGSSLDGWLKERGEAICVGRSWLPLLSPSLATASAFAIGESQAALSVALDLTDQGELEHYRFCLSQVCPDASVDRGALEALAQRKPKARTVPAALKSLKAQIPVLEQLVKLTTVLRERRLQAGSIDLDLPMPPLDRLGDLLEPAPDGSRQGWLVEHDTSHPAALLREAVLVAGRALGRHFTALDLPALFAINPPAEPVDINEVAKAALALELPLELSADGNASAGGARGSLRRHRSVPGPATAAARLSPPGAAFGGA